MPITVPKALDEMQAETFAAPVANALNRGLGVAAISTLIPAITVSAGAQTTIIDKTFTVPASLAGVAVFWSVGCNAAGVGDLLCYGPLDTFNTSIPNISGAVSGCATFAKPAADTTLRIRFQIYAWGGGTISVDGTKSNFLVQSLGFVSRNTLAFPT